MLLKSGVEEHSTNVLCRTHTRVGPLPATLDLVAGPNDADLISRPRGDLDLSNPPTARPPSTVGRRPSYISGGPRRRTADVCRAAAPLMPPPSSKLTYPCPRSHVCTTSPPAVRCAGARSEQVHTVSAAASVAPDRQHWIRTWLISQWNERSGPRAAERVASVDVESGRRRRQGGRQDVRRAGFVVPFINRNAG